MVPRAPSGVKRTACEPWFWVPVPTPAILFQMRKQAQTRWPLTKITPPVRAGPRSSAQLCAAEKPVLLPARSRFPGRKPDEHSRLPGIASQCPDNRLPCGRGHRETSSLLGVWCGQARAAICRQPCGEQGTGCPSSQMLPGQSGAPGISFRTRGHLVAFPAAPVSCSAPKSSVPGLCQQGPRLRYPSGQGTVAWTRHLVCVNPHSQASVGPGTQKQGELEPGTGHSLRVPAK